MTKVAIIDMGTNTFHLLIAETGNGEYRILERKHEAVKIGMGGINEGFISAQACERAIGTMKKFREAIDRHHITRISAYGTSALRSAQNGPLLAEQISARTGIDVRIISGDEEADLIFEGIRSAIELGNSPALVVDIGAGSVEFVIGNNQGILWKKSFEIGGQRLLEKFQKNDPILPEEIAALDQYFATTLVALVDAIRRFKPVVLVGSSGSFDTLSEIYCIRNGLTYDCAKSETPLSKDGFYNIYREIVLKNRDDRMKIPGMIALRVDMIVVASCLIRFVCELHPFEAIRVSTYSLKEGALSVLVRTGE